MEHNPKKLKKLVIILQSIVKLCDNLFTIKITSKKLNVLGNEILWKEETKKGKKREGKIECITFDEDDYYGLSIK